MFRGTAIHNIFEASFGFRVGWGTAGVGFVGGTGHWAIILCGLKTFLMFPSFLGF